MSLKSLLAIQLLSLCHSFKDTCPSKSTSELCTEDNYCETCALEGTDYGCKYCNYEWNWYPNKYCYWHCVECKEGYTLKESWTGNHYCEATTATTTPPPNDETCKWNWIREYRNYNILAAIFSWFTGPSFTHLGTCQRYTDGSYETDAVTSISLVITDVKIDGQAQSAINSGQWQFQCDRDGECNDFGQYGGAKAYVNKFDTLNGLDLDVAVFAEDGTATIKEKDVSVTKNSLKFGFSVSDGISYSESLEICIDNWVYTWRIGQVNYTTETDGDVYYYGDNKDLVIIYDDDDKTTKFQNKDNGRIIKLGEYAINNDPIAKCVGYDDINVDISTDYERIVVHNAYFGTSAFGKATICYKFPHCESGNILYDPLVYYEGEEEDSSYIVKPILGIILCMLLCY